MSEEGWRGSEVENVRRGGSDTYPLRDRMLLSKVSLRASSSASTSSGVISSAITFEMSDLVVGGPKE